MEGPRSGKLELTVAWMSLALTGAICAQAAPRSAQDAIEVVVEDGWLPVPVFVVQEVPVPSGSWKRNAGWSHRELTVEHRVVDGALEIPLSDGDGYCGAPLTLRLEPAAKGCVSVSASGAEYSCVSRGQFFDLHGEVRLERPSADGSRPLRCAFLIDAIEDGHFLPLRTEGAVEVAAASGEWDIEIDSPAYLEPDLSPPSTALGEVWWRWSDGKPRAHGWVDGPGRRHGQWETWFASGACQSTTEFLGGERHGLWRTVDEKGSCSTEGHVEHGVQQGEWTYTYKDGEQFRTSYRDGRMTER